jgi:PleD family two-component response regulator
MNALAGRSFGHGLITVSIGAVEHQHGENSERLIYRVDRWLYAAKQEERDLVRW